MDSGILKITNLVNNKIYLEKSKKVKALENRIKFELKMGSLSNKPLQEDYKQFGLENFKFEPLELVDLKGLDVREANKILNELEKKWFEKLEPYGEKCYNTRKKEVDREKLLKLKEKRKDDIEKNQGDFLSIKGVSELFWNSSIDEIKNGFVRKNDKYICTCCGRFFEEGVIYPKGNKFLQAKKAIVEHIKEAHESVFEILMQMDKKYTGLSDIQTSLIEDFFRRKSDKEIAEERKLTTSAIRNHRFRLKEKQKQAKVFLALMDLLYMENLDEKDMVEIHKGAKQIDERYAIREKERKKILEKFVLEDGSLVKFPKKEKEKIVILMYLANHLNYGVKYKESQINKFIKEFHDDFVTVRRYLIAYGFLERTRDGKEYWLNEN